MSDRRIGAYVLPGDPVWLAKSLGAYYPLLDDLVIPVPRDGRGWMGQRLPAEAILEIVAAVDVRGIRRTIEGEWIDRQHPLAAETAQRQAALHALEGHVDWVLQIDNDEYVPEPATLLRAIDEAERLGLAAVEWPMRVLYRRTKRWVFEVVAAGGASHFEYPGPIAVRPGIVLVDARRAHGAVLRAVVEGDRESLQVRRPPAVGEMRWEGVTSSGAIVHDSWARSPREIWRKVRGWGHADGWRTTAYYLLRWLPSPLTWRWARDLHPFSEGLWPRLARRRPTPELTE